MTFDLFEAARQKRLIVAHRGVSGGNIPCNTLAAYEIALKQGADMIEVDVEISADGTLYILHPGMEPRHLYHMNSIRRMHDDEIAALRYVNTDWTPTQFGLNTIDEVFETFKGRCFINVDKFWGNPKQIHQAIKRHGITDQIVVKSSPSDKVLAVLEEVAPELLFMPIVRDTHPLHESLMKRNIRYIGAEVLFTDESAEVASPAFLERMHADGKLVWANAIIYNYREQLSAGHSDDTALCEDMERGWGWLARHGFDLIQTDWPGMLIDYLRSQNLLWKV